MKKFLCAIFSLFLTSSIAISGSMFDNDGNYSGNWKQMTNVSTSHYSSKYKTSNYTDSAWHKNIKSQQAMKNSSAYSNSKYIETTATPFRYNTLDYTRSRKVTGGHGESYNARCHDIGDVSFCR